MNINIDQIFRSAGIEKEQSDRVLDSICIFTSRKPKKSIELKYISELSGVPLRIVKEVFYLLLNAKKLSATYVPRHKKCGKPIGKEEKSPNIIYKNIDNGIYDVGCVFCQMEIEEYSDIDIQIIFWNNKIKC